MAVKVQYNDLRKRFKSDVTTINLLLTIGAWLHPKVDFSWILQDFVEALQQELDFTKEARNAERCSRDLADFKYVHVPTVYWEYTKTVKKLTINSKILITIKKKLNLLIKGLFSCGI